MKIKTAVKTGEMEEIRELEFEKGEIEIDFLLDFITFEIKEEIKDAPKIHVINRNY